MHALSKRKATPEEYLESERQAATKSEYLAGEIHALAGASERHNLIAINAAYLLVGQLKGRPCKTYSNDMRVKVDFSGLYTYPDVVVVAPLGSVSLRLVLAIAPPVMLRKSRR